MIRLHQGKKRSVSFKSLETEDGHLQYSFYAAQMKEGGKRRERSFLMLSFLTKKISIFKQNQEGDGQRLSLNYHKLSKVGNFIDGQIFIRSYSL